MRKRLKEKGRLPGGKSMRKRLKEKRRSCAYCKPHKRGLANRWKHQEFIRLKEAEQDIHEKGD